jgi:hypothetical protein
MCSGQLRHRRVGLKIRVSLSELEAFFHQEER